MAQAWLAMANCVRQNLLVCASAGTLRNGSSRTAVRTATRSAAVAAMDWPPPPPFRVVGVGAMGCACRGATYTSMDVYLWLCQDMHVYGRVSLCMSLLDSCKRMGWSRVERR
jgi:hypothetical protein